LVDLSKNPIPNISLETIDDLNLWTGVIVGPLGTPFEGGYFQFEIRFPLEYPFKAPIVKIKTLIYHPNIDGDGSICIGILKPEAWKPANQMKVVLHSIVNLFTEPNPDDPLETSIAEVYKNDRPNFIKTAKEWTIKHASNLPKS
jgi:ubiquitin-conjugating enzyme E2 D/E